MSGADISSANSRDFHHVDDQDQSGPIPDIGDIAVVVGMMDRQAIHSMIHTARSIVYTCVHTVSVSVSKNLIYCSHECVTHS